MSDLNSDNSGLWSGPSWVFPRWIPAVAPKANCRLSWMGFRGSRVELRPLRGLAPLDRLRRSPAAHAAGRVKSRRPDWS